MSTHIAIPPSDLPDQGHGIAAGTSRVAQAYGRLPPAALMLLAVVSVGGVTLSDKREE